MAGDSHRRAATAREEIAWLAAAAVAARACGAPLARIIDCRGRTTRATGKVLTARRAAVYLASVGANVSRRALERATGLNRQTLIHHLRTVEDDRELKAELDVLMDELTGQLQAALATVAGEAMAASERRRVAA